MSSETQAAVVAPSGAEGARPRPTLKTRILNELQPQNLLPSAIGGLVAGMITVILSISFAMLIFGGELKAHLPAGIGLVLFSAVLVATIVALTSSYAATVAIPQDRIAPILALISGAVVTTMHATASTELMFQTVVASITVASLLTGLCLAALGVFKLGALIRYIPFPVIGGFLAGTGLLLVKGSLGVMTDHKVSWSHLEVLFSDASLVKWLPGAGFAVVMLLVSRRFKHYLIMPAMLLGGIAVFYAALAAMGVSATDARADGWLLGPFPAGDAWRPLGFSSMAAADWGVITGQVGSLATILLVSAVSVLLNSSALELAAERDMDLNRELNVTGAANIVIGLSGGMVGFHTLSLSGLVLKMGARGRLTGLVSACVSGSVLLAGTAVLEYFPKPVLGGLLFFLGLSFLVEWGWDGWRRLSRGDYFVVALILLFVAAFGYLQGVGVGIVACVALFVINYSRLQVVRQATSGLVQRSNVDRPPRHGRVLDAEGGRVHILRLSGYVFFGTANRLLTQVRERVDGGSAAALDFVVIDFQRVGDIDSSSVMSFVKMAQLGRQSGFLLIFTDVSAQVRHKLEREGLDGGPEDGLHFFTDLDHGLEWCEDRVIEGSAVTVDRQGQALRDRLREVIGEEFDVDQLLGYLERREYAADQAIIQQGDPPGSIYLLDAGQVTVRLELADGQQVRLRTMNAGSVVGELGLYLGAPRTASVVTTRDCVIYKLNLERLDQMRVTHTDAASAFHHFMAHVLAERLVQANRMLATVVD
mgnify:CR=1 FL=1